MRKRKQEPEPDVIRLANVTAKAAPSFTITNLSVADVLALHDGSVPAWIHDTAAFWLRDHPQSSDLMPASCDPAYDAPQRKVG